MNRLISKTATLSEGKTARIECTYIYGTALVGTKKLYLNNVLSETLSYTYDKSGNIATVIKDGTLLESYQYDELGQLVKTTKGSDIYEYTYDTRGNILTAKLNGVVTDTYTYGDANWKDKLTAFNGQTVTYDEIGNITFLRDMWFAWTDGRRLREIISDDGLAYSTFTYNADGLRVKNSFLDIEEDQLFDYYYEYNGNLLVRQSWLDNVMWFLYDESGSPVGFILNDTEYYYIKNLQGDITAITDANGTILAKYTYDVWGKPLSITDGNGNDVSANKNHIAYINPLRYRGYYYDSEMGVYYLLTRYYDPVTRRFINADGYVSTGQDIIGYNMFIYCGNNPIIRVDLTGTAWEDVKTFFGKIGAAVSNGFKKLVNAAADAFQVEFGVGTGYGVSSGAGQSEISATVYHHPLTVGYDDGATYTAITGKASIGLKAGELDNGNISASYEHRFETNHKKEWDEHTTVSTPFEVISCGKTKKEWNVLFFEGSNEGESKTSHFVGLDVSLHYYVGAHLTIGWDMNEFLNKLKE